MDRVGKRVPARIDIEPQVRASTAGLPELLLDLLRCIECGRSLSLERLIDPAGYPQLGADGVLLCTGCGHRYPIIGGTPRLLPRSMLPRLWRDYPLSEPTLRACASSLPPGSFSNDSKQRTADSFAYEWERFGQLRQEWRKNFLDYMRPHPPESFAGRLVLDVGTGSGRHSFHAAGPGARVVAVDLGRSIDVARRNLPREVLTVQADADQLPFAPGTFDFVMSIGVLHHLPDPQAALCAIAPFARPGGHVHIYLYWIPELRWHASILRLVGVARRVTVRLPHHVLHALCVPVAAILAIVIVWPYRMLRRVPPLRPLAGSLPLKTYADYPFAVLVNDQFDRFSAPIEHRYRREEVAAMLAAAGLADPIVLPSHGWVGDGLMTEHHK